MIITLNKPALKLFFGAIRLDISSASPSEIYPAKSFPHYDTMVNDIIA
jgi:hypothetical protein